MDSGVIFKNSIIKLEWSGNTTDGRVAGSKPKVA